MNLSIVPVFHDLVTGTKQQWEEVTFVFDDDFTHHIKEIDLDHIKQGWMLIELLR